MPVAKYSFYLYWRGESDMESRSDSALACENTCNSLLAIKIFHWVWTNNIYKSMKYSEADMASLKISNYKRHDNVIAFLRIILLEKNTLSH